MKGDLAGAESCFEEVLRIGYELDNIWTIVSASVDLGASLRQQGELSRAEAIYRAGLARASQAAGAPGFVGRLEAFLAFLLLERGELAEAKQLNDHAIAHNQSWQNPNHCAYAWMVKARLDLAAGLPGEAATALSEAGAWAARGPVVPPLQAAIEQTHIRLWIQTGENEKILVWLARQQFPALTESAPLSEVDEVLRTAAARGLLSEGRRSDALGLLAPLETAARRSNRISALVEILVLQACSAADPAAAALALREALILGLPRGFRQVFLEDGLHLVSALETCQDISGVSELLSLVRGRETSPPPGGPLTAREIEILRWVASGLSNPDIGSRLYISAGTVKAHTAAIYRKLDVANRAEAIARAKDLGLL